MEFIERGIQRILLMIQHMAAQTVCEWLRLSDLVFVGRPEACFSCLLWCADGWDGAFWMRYPFPLLCVFYLCSSSALWLSLPGFIYRQHPWLPPLFHHRICWGPSWAGRLFHHSLSARFPPSLCASQGSATQWLWNEMSLNRAMCPGATVIAGEIQLPL